MFSIIRADIQRRKSMMFTNFRCTGSEVLIGDCPFTDLRDFSQCVSESVAHVRCHRGEFVPDTLDDEDKYLELEQELDEDLDVATDDKNDTQDAGENGQAPTASPETIEKQEAPIMLNKFAKNAPKRKGKVQRKPKKVR